MLFISSIPISSKFCRFFSSIKTCAKTAIANNNEIELKGWVKSLRKLKEHVFFDINDGSSCKNLQIVLPQSLKPSDLSVGASVIVHGVLKESLKGDKELHATSIDVCGSCDFSDGYPFRPKKTYSPEYIREHLHFRPRTNQFSSLLRIRSRATAAIHEYFQKHEFVNVHTPILTSNDCEGAGETFFVQPQNEALLKQKGTPKSLPEEAYFGRKTFLTVSGQLHLEAAVYGLGKVYTFGPTFRAENSKSRLHLSEFYMVEAEMAFVDNLQRLLDVTEGLIKFGIRTVVDNSAEEISMRQSADVNLDWIDRPFPVLEYDECVSVLEKNQQEFTTKFDECKGFSKEHELFLANYCGNIPVFVINWPKDNKPFYMKSCSNDSTKVAAFDLLAPNVGELVGGSLREENCDILKSKIPNENPHLDWYLELRKYGQVPTGGFGLGFERYLQVLLGVANIKDTIPFPRWPHNCRL